MRGPGWRMRMGGVGDTGRMLASEVSSRRGC